MDTIQKAENGGDSEVKYVVDATRALSSNQGEIDMFEDQVAAYDTCVADEGDGSYIEVNANDDDDINLYSDIENELIKVVGNQIDGGKEAPDNGIVVVQPGREPAEKTAADKEEGELTPEPDTTGDFRTTAVTPKYDLLTASGQAADVSRVLEEFNKRLAEIQAEAKRQSLALQKTFAEKLKADTQVLKDTEKHDKPVKPVEKLPESRKPSEKESRVRHDDRKPEAAKSSGHRTSSRNRKNSADRKLRHRSAEDDKDRQRREDEKKADEEFCIDCITEKIQEQVRRRNNSDDSGHRRSRTRYDRRSESPCRRPSRDRSRNRRRSSRDRSRDRRRSSRDRSRDRRRPSRSRSWDHRRSSRGRSRDRQRSSRDRSRNHRRSSRDDQSRGNIRFDKKSRSLDRTDGARLSPRRRRFSGHGARGDDYQRLSRRDKHFLLKETEKLKAANSGDERIEKHRMKTLVKRQMQIISDVIDNPNPKSGSIAIQQQHKECFESDAKKKRRKSSRESPDVAPESSDLNAMESFLEQLRDVRRKKTGRSEEAERLRRQKKLKLLQGATVTSGSPAQSRISIRRPADDVYVGGKKLYFTSGIRLRRAHDRRSQEKENLPSNIVSRDTIPAMKNRSDVAVVDTKTDDFGKSKEATPHEEKRSRSIEDGDDVREPRPSVPPTREQKDARNEPHGSRDGSVDGERHPKGSHRKPLSKPDRIRERSQDSGSSKEDNTEKSKVRKRKRHTTDPSSHSESDGDPRRRGKEYSRNAALCEKRALRKKKTVDRFKKSSSESESDSAAVKVKKKRMMMMKRKGSASTSSSEPSRKFRSRRHQLVPSGSDIEDVKHKRKVKRHVSESESDAGKARRHSKRLVRRKSFSESESEPRGHSKRLVRGKGVSESESEPRGHTKRLVRRKAVCSESEPEKVLPTRKRKLPTESEGSDDDSYEILKKNVISMCKKNGLDLNLLQLFLGDDDDGDQPKRAKRKQPKKNASKTRTLSKISKPREEIPEESKRIEYEEPEDPGPTLDELEVFLGKLRENRKETPGEEFHPALEMQSLRRECAFLDRHRAKRKAKLMACVALTAKASAKEARFLEALKKGKDEHEIEKEKMIRKLKAGNDAIFSALALNSKNGDRKPAKEPEMKIEGNDDSEDSIRNKMFGISFAFKSPPKKSTVGGSDQSANTVDILASEKAQAFLNSLRAKKKVKKSSQMIEDLPDKGNSA